MDCDQLNIGMVASENTKDFIGKGLADAGHLVEIEEHATKSVNALQQTLGLRARDEVFLANPRHPHRDYCFCESVLVGAAGILRVDVAHRSLTREIDAHIHRRAGVRVIDIEQDIIWLMVQVIENQSARDDLVVVEQNLKTTSMDVLKIKGQRTRLYWNKEHISRMGA